MQEKKLQVETVIELNSQEDLDKISSMKLDLQLLESQRKEQLKETKPPILKEPHVVAKICSVKAKATVRYKKS